MDQVKIGEFISELRHDVGMTQEALGQKIGVTNKTVSRWENGNYMPDIEMLKLLSDIFHISINELLCGERLNDDNFREKADRNLVNVLKSSCFPTKERFAFWERKWLKEHAALIILCVAAAIAIFVGVWMSSISWLVGICPLVWIIIYAVLRNQMMIYIENRVYGSPSDEK
jgi:Predicted transcriptional regulators